MCRGALKSARIFLAARRIFERRAPRLDGKKHERLPDRQLVEHLAVLQREAADERDRMREPVGLIAVGEDRRDGVELLAPEIGLGPAVLQTLPQHRPPGRARDALIELKVLDLVETQDRLDDARVELTQNLTESVELL